MARNRPQSISEHELSSRERFQSGFSTGHARTFSSERTPFRMSSEYDKEARPYSQERLVNHHDAQDYRQLPYYNSERSSWLVRARKKYGYLLAGILLLICVGYFFRPVSWPFSHTSDVAVSGFTGARNTFTFTNGTKYINHDATKVIGILFYGRRQFVNILECYLRRNLKVNGGMLDEVHFLMHTDISEDIEWLEHMIADDGMGKYYKLKREDTSGEWNKWTSFAGLYKKFMTDLNTIYVKMDDDLLFIDDYAIPELLRVSLEHPEAHSVQANIVNNKWNYWHHMRTNAIYPYLPESDTSSKWPVNTWRPSQLPRYEGSLPAKDANWTDHFEGTSEGHRWLPLQNTYAQLSSTPYGPRLPNPMFHEKGMQAGWAVTAQSHYSFFENHERKSLLKYSYGNDYDHTWNQWYGRYNINMMVIRGSYVLKRPFWNEPGLDKGDEFLLTKVIPESLDMPVLIATRAIAAHYSFRGDRTMMLHTDVLDRYRALANDLYCSAGNYKRRVGPKNPHHLTPSRSTPGSSPTDSADDGSIGDGPSDDFNIEHEGSDEYEKENYAGEPAATQAAGSWRDWKRSIR